MREVPALAADERRRYAERAWATARPGPVGGDPHLVPRAGQHHGEERHSVKSNSRGMEVCQSREQTSNV